MDILPVDLPKNRYGARPLELLRRRAPLFWAAGVAVATSLAISASSAGAQNMPQAEHRIHCDLSIETWEANWLLPFAAPIVVRGKTFSGVIVIRDSAAVLLYNSVRTLNGPREVTVFAPSLDQIITFHATHVYVDLPDYEPPSGWSHLGYAFFDLDQKSIKKFSLALRRKSEGEGGGPRFDVVVNPVETVRGQCIK